MRIELGMGEFPDEARSIRRRMMLRRAAHAVSAAGSREGRYKLEALADIDQTVASGYRPRMRDDTVLEGQRVKRGPFRIALDAFESAVLALCDGKASVGEIALEAANAMGEDRPADPIKVALQVLAVMASFDMLETGRQAP